MKRCVALLGVLSLVVTLAQPAAAEKLRAFERVGRTGNGATTVQTTAPAPGLNTGPALVVVDDSFPPSGTVLVGANSYTMGTDAFQTVQAGVDAVGSGGTVKVLPGAYSETAAGRLLFDLTGPYQFGVFVGAASPNITIQGVDGSGNPLTNAALVGVNGATINTNSTNDFGPSGFFIEGDGCTIAGVRIGTNSAGQNKTMEVIGDNFTLKDCDVADVYGSVYINDFRFNVGLDVSHVQSYHVTNCIFRDGVSIDLTSGAGYSGSAASRVISGNAFTNSSGDYWPMISFNGSNTGVPWFIYSVGGATITGNTFANADPTGQDIRARGTYDNSQFDWAAYWTANTYDKAVVVGPAPPANLRTYSYVGGYGPINDVRRIGSVIQPEVDHGLSGDIVLVKGGSYEEQVIVDGKNLTIQGAGRALTTIVSPVSLPVSFATPGNNNFPIVLAKNASDVRIQDLTIDGAGRGSANYRFQGMAWFNAGGKLINCDVTRIRENPFNGNQHGVGVYGYSDAGGPYAIEVGNCNITDFQKNGTVFASAQVTVNMHDCVVAGQGQTGLNAQNGIQVSSGTAGTISNCAVSGIYYTGPTYTAAGQLFYGAGAVNVSGGSVTGCQTGTYYIDCAGSLTGTSTSIPLGGGIGAWGMAFYNSSLTAAPGVHDGTSSDAPARPEAQPMDEETSELSQAPGTGVESTLSVAITGGCLTGPGTPGTEGIDVYSAGGPMNVSVTGMEISGWNWGMWVGGPGGSSMDANHNRITGNTIGYEGQATATNLAERNWWGHAGGPGVGGANPVVGATVDYDPWLTSGADANPGCGFAPANDNVIAPIPPTSCLSITNTCLTVPVTISRTDSSPMRGYSVRLTLSSELDLCSGLGSIVQGSYLTGNTSFQVVPLGGGVYTVDCAILGASSCVTTPTGTLFSVAVKRTVTSGTGTVTVTPIKARDCVNAPIPVSAGAPASVTIDAVIPTSIANLAAAQQKTGNGTSGRTAINLTFTPPAGADSLMIYRAGFGHYPEYDDAGGAVPSTPTWPPASPWVKAATIVGTAVAYVDTPPTRDFWYYVVFSKDPCGNVSLVSNKTSGTLDYHLGDTHNGLTRCAGNNLVNLSDISFLGAHYGATIVLNDTLNCLDVGPTTDYSVDKRPTTDNVLDFEDLIMFAINYGQVSSPTGPTHVVAEAANELSLSVPTLPARGELFEVALNLDGAGDIQGLSVDMVYNPLVVQPDAVASGELLARQGQGSTVLSSKPGNVDVALLGVAQGIAGKGELARMAFRVVGDGDPGLGVKQVRARDGQNRTVTIGQRNEPITGAHPPVINYLGANYPNPFMHSTVIPYGVKAAGRARLAVFDVQGRLVRGLLDGESSAGERVMTWDGRDDSGSPVASGLYLVRLEVGGQVLTRSLKLVK